MKTWLKLYPKFPKKRPIRWVAYGGWVSCLRIKDVLVGKIIEDDPNLLKKLVGYNADNLGWILDVCVSADNKWITVTCAFKTFRLQNSVYNRKVIELLIPNNKSGKWWKDD